MLNIIKEAKTLMTIFILRLERKNNKVNYFLLIALLTHYKIPKINKNPIIPNIPATRF